MRIFFVGCFLVLNILVIPRAMAVCTADLDTHANYVECRFVYLNCAPEYYLMDMEKIATVYIDSDQTGWIILMDNGVKIKTDACGIAPGKRPWEPYWAWIEFLKKNPKYMKK